MKKAIRTIKTIICCVFLAAACTGFAAVYGYMQPRIKVVREHVEVPVEVEPEKKSIKELLQEVPPKYGVSPLLAQAIMERESNGRMDAIRFEAHHMERARKAAPKGSPEDTVRLYASSVCSFQVMGWWAPKFNLSPIDLFQPETCIEVSMSILADCMGRHKNKSKVEQIHGALACYNGSTKYADAVLARLGEKLVEQHL